LLWTARFQRGRAASENVINEMYGIADIDVIVAIGIGGA
jgi:hypothetical protein